MADLTYFHRSDDRNPSPNDFRGLNSLSQYLEFRSTIELVESINSVFFDPYMLELTTQVLVPQRIRRDLGESVPEIPPFRIVFGMIESGEARNGQRYSHFDPNKDKYCYLDWYAYAVCGIQTRMSSPRGWFYHRHTLNDMERCRIVWGAIMLIWYERCRATAETSETQRFHDHGYDMGQDNVFGRIFDADLPAGGTSTEDLDEALESMTFVDDCYDDDAME